MTSLKCDLKHFITSAEKSVFCYARSMNTVKYSVGVICALLFVALLYFFPWKDITWGKIVMSPEKTVTVTGSAESKERNQIANFSAGVNVVKDSKEEAIKDVNDKITAITAAVKTFGVDPTDIQTQSMSVYQRQDTYYDNGVQKSRSGQWDVSNTISIILRDVDRASDLGDLLAKSGATNVYGPNFQLDTSNNAEDALMADAIANARVKAEAMAKASGTTLDSVISVIEGSNGGVNYPLSALDGRGGGGVALEPGSTTVGKTVTVVWSLK